MKKLTIILSVLICFSAFEAKAARRYIPKPYMGVDASYIKTDFDEGYDKFYKDNTSSYSINAGLRYNEYFGFEIYYQQAQDAKNNEFSSEMKYTSYGFDIIGYAPTSDLSLSMLFTGGFGKYEYEAKRDGEKDHKFSEKEINMRLGIGFQYNFTRNFAIRTIGRYVMSSSDYVKSHIEGVAGIQMTF